MPLARIDLAKGKSPDYRKTIGEVVYDAMVETLKVPKDDRFQIITEHAGGDFIVDPNYLGIQRSKDCVIVQLTLNEGRTVDQNLRPQDVFVSLVEVKKENWSFGNGEAQYAS